MEVTQFYLHLPNNSSLDKFPHDTLTEYRVSLPQTLYLTGEWEVALTEIHYPHSWNNIQQFRFYVRNEKLHGVWDSLEMLPGHYSSVEDVLHNMKELVDNANRYTDDVRFSYDNLSRKVTVYLKNNAEVSLNDMAYMLGFTLEQIISKTTKGDGQVDLEYGFHDLFVYCDLIQSQYVGDALVPLLRIVPVGEDGQRVSKSFVRSQYAPVSRKQFETIEVNMKRDTGESVPFEFGSVLLTLHFRQSQPQYF